MMPFDSSPKLGLKALAALVVITLLGQSANAAPAVTDRAKSPWTPVGAESNGTIAIQALVERRLPAS